MDLEQGDLEVSQSSRKRKRKRKRSAGSGHSALMGGIATNKIAPFLVEAEAEARKRKRH